MILQMFSLAPFLAALDFAWLKLFVLIVVALIYLINHGIRVATKKTQQPPRPPKQPAGVRPQPPSRNELNDEVADFLRRSQEKRTSRPAQAEVTTESRQSLSRRLPSQRPAPVVEAVAVEEPPTGAGVAAHVARHLDTGDFNQRARELTTVDHSVEAIESHLSQVFTHPLGQLGTRPAEAAPAATAPSALTTIDGMAPALPTESITSLLADPQNLRNAVVLNEILRRPTERW